MRSTSSKSPQNSDITVVIIELLARELGPGDVVVMFDPLPGEVDVRGISDSPSLNELNVAFALTRTPTTGYDLTIHPAASELELHRFGYRQPVAGSPLIPDEEITAVLVPALAFDRWGNRLGFGAGYYDRLLARLPRAHKIGVADLIVEQRLPTEAFDIPVTHLATAEGIVVIE